MLRSFACWRGYFNHIPVLRRTGSLNIASPKIRHYSDVIISAMASQITGVSNVCSTVCSGVYQRKHQSSASLVFVRGIHRWPVDSLHKGSVTRKMFPFHDVNMNPFILHSQYCGFQRRSSLRCKGISSHSIELHIAHLKYFPCWILLSFLCLFQWVQPV